MIRTFLSEHFRRQLKWHIKKYPSLNDDISFALASFPTGNAISLGGGLYKIRLRSSDLPKGKSHAFRMIILFVSTEGILAPITIYSKSDRANISRRELKHHVDSVRAEIIML